MEFLKSLSKHLDAFLCRLGINDGRKVTFHHLDKPLLLLASAELRTHASERLHFLLDL